jgi:predicted CXXCH cytochrome family protein
MLSRRFKVAGLAAVFAAGVGFFALPARAEEPFCFECHDDFPNKMKAFAFTHEPAANGECTACHVDHKDQEKLMLVKEGADLCYECHDNMATGTSVHAPVAAGKCTDCHNPHGSATKKMLVAGGQKLCEKCHANSPEFGRKVMHAALDDGCSTCHKPHNSTFPKLLTANLTLDRLARFDPSQAQLCFGCHEEKSYTASQSEDTGFRMGQTNLHALHLNGGAVPNKYGILKKKDGQTCFACHLPHSADQERLVRTEYLCTGTACFTMRYIRNDKGGTCVVGCHKPRTYARDGMDPNSTAGLVPASSPEQPVAR